MKERSFSSSGYIREWNTLCPIGTKRDTGEKRGSGGETIEEKNEGDPMMEKRSKKTSKAKFVSPAPSFPSIIYLPTYYYTYSLPTTILLHSIFSYALLKSIRTRVLELVVVVVCGHDGTSR